MSQGLRVVVCDDHRVLTDALVSFLRGEPDVLWADACYDGDEAIRRIRTGADVLLLDIGLGGECDGIAVVEAARHLGLQARVLLMSGIEDPRTIARGLQLGATGFCGKDVRADHLMAAVKRVAAGTMSLPGHLVEPVLRELEGRRDEADNAAVIMSQLTSREQEVLRLLAGGRGSQEIARTMGLSTSTVRTHLQHVMRKLGVHSQLHAAAEGRRLFSESVAS